MLASVPEVGTRYLSVTAKSNVIVGIAGTLVGDSVFQSLDLL